MNRCAKKTNTHVRGFQEALDRIKAQQTDTKILRLIALLGAHPKVRWKDSIKKVIAKHNGSTTKE